MPKDITPFQFNIKFSMDVSSVLWVHVFSYLDEKDQASVSDTNSGANYFGCSLIYVLGQF